MKGGVGFGPYLIVFRSCSWFYIQESLAEVVEHCMWCRDRPRLSCVRGKALLLSSLWPILTFDTT